MIDVTRISAAGPLLKKNVRLPDARLQRQKAGRW